MEGSHRRMWLSSHALRAVLLATRDDLDLERLLDGPNCAFVLPRDWFR